MNDVSNMILYDSMSYFDGQTCPGGVSKSAIVSIQCGSEGDTHISHIDDSSNCEMKITLSIPLDCHLLYADPPDGHEIIPSQHAPYNNDNLNIPIVETLHATNNTDDKLSNIPIVNNIHQVAYNHTCGCENVVGVRANESDSITQSVYHLAQKVTISIIMNELTYQNPNH